MHVGISRVGQAGPWMVGIHAYLLLIIMISTVISLSMLGIFITAGILCTFMKRVHTINENVDCMI
jgi:hypothetical protein